MLNQILLAVMESEELRDEVVASGMKLDCTWHHE
jgi:hypothetical protein